MSGNHFTEDPAVYGCLYHDGGSALWNDQNNVFNHIKSHCVFTHGSSPNTTVDHVWYNDSGAPNLQGDTNFNIRDASGKCLNASIVDVKLKSWHPWPAPARAIIDNAGRRVEKVPHVDDLVAPPLSPPAVLTPVHECPHPGPSPQKLGAFAVEKCETGRHSQEWVFSPGVAPGDSKTTNVKSAAASGAGCWEITGCSSSKNADVGCAYGCKPLPKPGSTDKCAHNGAWSLNKNGTVTSTMDGHCLQVSGNGKAGSAVTVGKCTGKLNQNFQVRAVAASSSASGKFVVTQGELCVDNNYKP